MEDQLVLVTGGSGFLGSHTLVALLDRGYRVRATVRPGRESTVRALVGGSLGERLSFAVADLNSDQGWDEAMAGCHGVIHVASPFFQVPARRENELIVPAREGTLRVLRAARNAGVRRVVLTSSSEAVVHGRAPDRPYTEEDWSNPDHGMSSYGKSKVLAERAAWDFVAREGRGLELAVVNPVGIYGPPLGTELSTSVDILAQMLAGRVPRLPRMGFDVVDVRDVADLHVRALESPEAAGQRFLATAGTTSLVEIAGLLKKHLGLGASRVSDKTVPDWVMRFAGLFVPELAQVGAYLGTPRVTTAEKARRLLGWSPRSVEEAILASAEALVSPRARSA